MQQESIRRENMRWGQHQRGVGMLARRRKTNAGARPARTCHHLSRFGKRLSVTFLHAFDRDSSFHDVRSSGLPSDCAGIRTARSNRGHGLASQGAELAGGHGQRSLRNGAIQFVRQHHVRSTGMSNPFFLSFLVHARIHSRLRTCFVVFGTTPRRLLLPMDVS
eukprot:scaffold358_cov343-Pavlova_lutheri.AAC.12